MLRYLLDVETRGSQSLLNVKAFIDPTAYKLKVKRAGSDESRKLNVDLLVSHRDGHHAGGHEDAGYLAQTARWRYPRRHRARQPGARRVVHAAGLFEQRQ